MFPLMALKSASKSEVFLQVPSGFVFPTAKPRVPAADTASGAATIAVDMTVRKCMIKVFTVRMTDYDCATQLKSSRENPTNAKEAILTRWNRTKERLRGSVVRRNGRIQDATKIVSGRQKKSTADARGLKMTMETHTH